MFNLSSEIYKGKVVRLVLRVTQAANLAEGIPVGKAERDRQKADFNGQVISG